MRETVFEAGSPALTFANRAGPERTESYADLAAAALHMGLIDAGQCALLQERAEATPFRAEEALNEARILTRVLHRIFAALAQKSEPEAGDIDFLNGSLARALTHAAIQPTTTHGATGYDWAWRDDADMALDCMLWPVARDAAELLVGQDPARIRACQGAECHRLFLDVSKAGRRRWCQMETCGNRAKARRYAGRHSSGTGNPTRGLSF